MSSEERDMFEEYINLVEKCMNNNVDPCDDFVEYASGRFQQASFDKRIGEYSPSLYGCAYVIQSLLDNERITNVILEKARDFRRSRLACLQGGIKEYLKSDQFNEFCGGFPSFNENWNPDNFIWARTIGILSALQYNTILSLSMEHLDNTKVFFVYVLGFPTHDLQKIEDNLKTLELDDQNLAEIVNDLNYIKEIYPEDLGDDYFRRSGLQLEEDLELFDFKEFIEIALSVTVHNDDIIHLQEGVMNFISFLNRLGRRVLANYLTAMIAHEDFAQHSESMSDEILVNIFRPILISAGFQTYYNNFEDMKFRYAIKRFNESFKPIECKFPEDIREREKESFRADYDQMLEYIKENYNYSKMFEEYADLQISNHDFYQNLINIRNHGIPESVKKFDSLRGFHQEINRSILGFIDFLVSHWRKPMVFNFSGYESSLWNFIIGTRNNDENGSNSEQVDNMRKILQSQAAAHKISEENLNIDSVISIVEALEYTYQDYKVWMEENEANVIWQNEMLSRINLDCHKLFFVAFCQHLSCFPFPEENSVTFTLMNCEDFSKVFSCSKESRMNPRKFV